jgi:predicted Zn-dependent protease
LELAPTPDMKAEVAADLFAVQRQQHKREAALKTAVLVSTTDPSRHAFEAECFDLLQELGRHEEALPLIQAMMRRDPANPRLHRHYNSLLHQRRTADGQGGASVGSRPP